MLKTMLKKLEANMELCYIIEKEGIAESLGKTLVL